MDRLCEYFGNCGGCTSQHISYDSQLNGKKDMVMQALRLSCITLLCDDAEVFSGRPLGYRNRMDFVFSGSKLGFRKKGKWDKIIDITQCPISNEKVNILLDEVREWFKINSREIDVFNLNRKSGTFCYAVIRAPESTGDSCVSFAFNEESQKIGTAIDLVKGFAESSSANNVVVTYVPVKGDFSVSSECFAVKGDVFLSEKIGKHLFRYSVQGFFQNNSALAGEMVGYCHGLFESYDTKDSFLLDLYGGTGLFGISLSDIFSKVLTVESFKESTDCAEENIRINDTKNVQALCHDASRIDKLDIKGRSGGKPVFVLVDPPRSGMDRRTVLYLLDMKPEVIVYVSCNPFQMSKELAFLKQSYDVKSVAVFDMFPQTEHVECIVELVKK